MPQLRFHERVQLIMGRGFGADSDALVERLKRLDDLPEISRGLVLPDEAAREKWSSIVAPRGWKDQLINEALATVTLRSAVQSPRLPLHGVIILSGRPGTGKTTLAEGLGDPVARALGKPMLFIEVNAHRLTGGQLGKSQKSVDTLLQDTIPTIIQDDLALVMIDEVETMTTDRQQLSMSANPIDVHRAVDAALVGIDRLTSSHKKLLVVATTNFESAVDEAFVSRADLVLRMPDLDTAGREQILRDTLRVIAGQYPAVSRLADSAVISDLAVAAASLDPRQLRKVAALACSFRREVSLDPSAMSEADLRKAASFLGQGK